MTPDLADFGRQYTSKLAGLLQQLDYTVIESIAQQLMRAHREGRRVYVIGNGGSAATAAHFVCDLGKNTACGHVQGIRVMALTDNVPISTALSNDHGYEALFERQLRTLVEPGDIVMAISASGNSPNIVNGLKAAREVGAATIALLGFDGGAARALSDVALVIESFNYGHVEDAHMIIGHVLAQHLRECFSGLASR
jgi:D-sedoheptulose 7-phosphate isomerase